MAELMDYTTPDEIRATLGASPIELSDETLEQPIYDTLFKTELEDIYSDLETVLDEIEARFKADPDSLTLTEKRLYETVKVFSAYATSKSLNSTWASAAKKITDGKAAVERFEKSFAAVMGGILQMYYDLRARIRKLLRALGFVIADPVFTGAFVATAGLAINPITNE